MNTSWVANKVVGQLKYDDDTIMTFDIRVEDCKHAKEIIDLIVKSVLAMPRTFPQKEAADAKHAS